MSSLDAEQCSSRTGQYSACVCVCVCVCVRASVLCMASMGVFLCKSLSVSTISAVCAYRQLPRKQRVPMVRTYALSGVPMISAD